MGFGTLFSSVDPGPPSPNSSLLAFGLGLRLGHLRYQDPLLHRFKIDFEQQVLTRGVCVCVYVYV